MDLTLAVLAAGIGSRYGGLKQVDPVGKNGEGIIDYSVYDAVQAGFNKIVFIIRRDIEEDFRNIIGRKYESKLDVVYVFQELKDIPGEFKIPEGREKPWGTAHAILSARSAITSPFAVINGDDFYGRNAYRILADYLKTVRVDESSYAMVGYILRNTLSEHGFVSRGICRVNSEGNLEEVIERLKIEKAGSGAVSLEEDGSTTQLTGDEIVSMNMFGFTPFIFQYLEKRLVTFLRAKGQELKTEFLIPEEANYLIQENKGTMKVLRSSAVWFGITYREDKPYVVNSIQKLVDEGAYPAQLS